ncbi:MAG: cellulose biosynthesis protein BcsQ [Paralcaligenes sp.]
MKIITVISACGGVGKTTLVASQATLLLRRQIAVVTLEMTRQNVLGSFLGLPDRSLSGLLAHTQDGQVAWPGATHRNEEGVCVVPFGQVDMASATAFDAMLMSNPDWLASQLQKIDLAENGVILLDTAVLPDIKTAQAIRCADLVLCVTRPEPAASASLAQFFDMLQADSRELKIVANGVSPERPLHYDMLTMLRARVGIDTLLPLRIHLDGAVPEAYARGTHCFDVAPHSQAAHDLQGLANWLTQWVKTGKAH